MFLYHQVNKQTEYLFGLFDSAHMPFHLEADLTRKPTLVEMVDKALDILQSDDDKGFFLFVEGNKKKKFFLNLFLFVYVCAFKAHKTL